MRGRYRPRAIFSGKARTKLVIILFVDRTQYNDIKKNFLSFTSVSFFIFCVAFHSLNSNVLTICSIKKKIIERFKIRTSKNILKRKISKISKMKKHFEKIKIREKRWMDKIVLNVLAWYKLRIFFGLFVVLYYRNTNDLFLRKDFFLHIFLIIWAVLLFFCSTRFTICLHFKSTIFIVLIDDGQYRLV